MKQLNLLCDTAMPHPLYETFRNYSFTLILSLAALLLYPLKAGAQNGGTSTLSSRVTDAAGHALPGVTLQLLGVTDSAQLAATASDQTGNWKLQGLAAGRYRIKAGFIGYLPVTGASFDLTAGETKILPVMVLRENVHMLGQASVTAKKPFIERQVDKTVLNIESDVIAAGGNALEALRRAPGVTLDKDDNIQLRGKAGVTVMLDGKITYLSSSQITTLLKNMPASSVQTIEVITQPSARYDAAGNTGIINIKTKKLKSAGFNGTVALNSSFAAHTRYGGSLNLNYHTGKFNFYTNYDHSKYAGDNTLDLDRKFGTGVTQSDFRQKTVFQNDYLNNNYKAGIDFSATKNHTIGVQLSGYGNSGENPSTTLTRIEHAPKPADTFLHAVSMNSGKYKSLDYNLNYRGVLDTSGTELSADLDYSRFNNASHASLSNLFTDSLANPLSGPFITRNSSPSVIDIRVGKIDFSHPFSKKFKMETGLKYSDVTTDNDVHYDSLRNGNYIPAPSLSNHFIYREKVAAAYASFNAQVKKTGIQFGLRVENTVSEGNSVTLQKDVKRNYTDFFPNLALSHKLNDNNQLGLSYTRRIDRPGYDDLNPFRYYLDQYTYGEGNPFLKPQYTNAFEASYTYHQSTFVSLNYSHTRDVTSQVLVQDAVTKVTKQTRDNLAALDSYGLTFSRPFILAKWWTLSGNLQVNYSQYKANAAALGGALEDGTVNYNINLTNSITLPQGVTLEVQGYYSSPAVYAYLHAGEMHSINLGLQKAFFNKKASLKLNVSDLFNTQKFHGSQIGNGVNLVLANKNESRRVGFSFSYHFGGQPYKGTRKETGSESEKSRVKSQ